MRVVMERFGDPWSVFSEMEEMQKRLNRVFSHWGGSTGTTCPPMNVWTASDENTKGGVVMTQANANLEKKLEGEVQPQPEVAGETYVPAVDIYEDDHGLVMRIEMPGVDDRSANVSIEKNVLSIEGKVHTEIPEGYSLVRAENDAVAYRRSFQLLGEIDPAGVKAKMKNGVLQVLLPKREEAKPRKIEISVN